MIDCLRNCPKCPVFEDMLAIKEATEEMRDYAQRIGDMTMRISSLNEDLASPLLEDRVEIQKVEVEDGFSTADEIDDRVSQLMTAVQSTCSGAKGVFHKRCSSAESSGLGQAILVERQYAEDTAYN